MGFSVMSQYKVIDGNAGTAAQLQQAAEVFWNRRDLKWAFPYVYCLVTKEIIKQSGVFNSSALAFRWVANFYEFYVLNLNAFVNGGSAEDPWMTAFTAPNTLRIDQPWGARSAAAFVLGMFAHIKSDLPRALAFIYLKFYSRDIPPQGGIGPPVPASSYDDAKGDFDTMNQKVFPAVMNQVAAGRTDVIPSIGTLLPDDWRNGLLGMFEGGKSVYKDGLPRERETSWRLGKTYADDNGVQDTANKLIIATTVTPMKITR